MTDTVRHRWRHPHPKPLADGRNKIRSKKNKVALETLGPVSARAQEFLAQIERRLTEVATDPRETAFLFQRLSVAVQRFNAACLADTFPISESPP